MSPILLLKVANFVIELFQIVFERHYLIFGGCNRVLQTCNVFIALPDNLLLVSDARLRGLNFRLDVLNGVA